MKKKKVIVPNIVAGGTAVPLGSNYYLMRGRKHEEGGIDVGANPRTGLEVEDGEVMQLKDKEIRVFSTVPFLNGQSPAQKVMGGENPNKVFAQQEAYKDRNNINDDGTRKAKYGKSSAIRTDDDKNVSAYNRAVYSSVDPTMGYPTKTEAARYAVGSLIKSVTNPDKMLYTVNDSVSDAAWRKRLGLSYDNKFLLPNKDGSVRLPKNLEREIPTDTVMLKNRIAANEKLAAKYPKHLSNGSTNEKREIVDWALLVDNMALDALRHTYKTGEPVVINEGAYNSRRLIENGELSYPGIMPHNVLQDYTLKYNKDNNTMEYSDIYDFNEYEWGVPGKPFNIKGSIPLKNKKGYGGNHLLNTKYKQKQVIDMKDNNSRTKAKAGLRYILQTNGNSRLGYVPSTGESLSEAKGRTKAELGIEKKDYKSLVRNMTDKELRNEYININKNVGLSNADADIRNKNRIISDEQHRRKKYNIPNFGFTEMVGLPQPPKENTKLSIPNIGINNNVLTDSIVEPVDSFSLTNHIKDAINVQKPVNEIAVKPNNIGTKNKEEGNYGFPTVTFGTGYVPTISGVNPSGGKLTDWWYPIKKNVTNTQTTPLNVNMPVSKVNRTLPNFNLTEIASYPKASNINIPTEIPNIGVNTDTIIMPMTRINTPVFNTSNSSSSTPEIKPINIKQDTQSFWDKTKNWINENPNTASEIASSAANIIGAITSYNTNKRMLNDLNYNIKPIPRIAAKLKTNININPQLDKMRESLANYERNIQSGTASSQVALARKQKARANSLSGYNELYGYKENAETELINKDRLNQQEVANQSIADYNSYIEKKMAFDNAVREKKAENVVSLVNNLASIPSDIITRTDKRRSDALNAALIMARNPNVTPEYLESLGIKLPGNKRKNNKKD